jgi:hypothetical protein
MRQQLKLKQRNRPRRLKIKLKPTNLLKIKLPYSLNNKLMPKSKPMSKLLCSLNKLKLRRKLTRKR